MLRALFLAMTILLLPLEYASADAPSDLGSNAALKYWQAFPQLPKLTHAEENKLSAECLTMPLDAHAREMVASAAYALRMMYRGAALPRCEWAIDWKDEGIEALLPQLGAGRVLSSLACLRARLRFEEGRTAEAIDDLLAALTLGRHVSLDGSLISILVGYDIERRVSETLALALPKFDSKTIKDLKSRLGALPRGESPAAGLRTCEENTLDWFARKVKQAKDKESLLALLSQVRSEGEGRDAAEKAIERGRAFLQECGGTADGLLKMIEETRPSYALMAKKLELPLDQFEKEFERETMTQAGNPVFKVFFPALPKMRQSQARADVRRALFAAAIDVQLDGPDALKNHPDPVAGGPFEMVPFEGGFELRSKFKPKDDKPWVLTVGRRGK
jgi:hypothetical protein